MDFRPGVEITRFAQLKPGDLFLYETDSGTCVALKAVDKQNDHDELIVLLGPNLPSRCKPGDMINRRDITAISFKNDYVVRLPSSSSGWRTQSPPPNKLALVLRDNVLHLRANCSLREGDFQACLVSFKDGTIRYGWENTILAFAVEWEILTNADPTLAGQIFIAP